MSTALRPATYADLEAVHPHLVAELIEGSFVTHRRPAPKLAVAVSALLFELGSAFRLPRNGADSWVIIREPEFHFGDDVAVPNLAGWRQKNLTALPETDYFEEPPEWACEVLSPSTEIYDRGPKRRIYARAGVSYLWLLDPRAELLETFVLREGGWLLTGTFSGPELVSAEPFDAIAFPLSLLWPFSDTASSDGETLGREDAI